MLQYKCFMAVIVKEGEILSVQYVTAVSLQKMLSAH